MALVEQATEATPDVKDGILRIVASKSGYDPKDLDLDFELEADLGIDTVKQAEILGELREQFGVAPDAEVTLAETPTIAGLAGWRWLFLLEGLVPVGFGLALPFLLPLGPEQAKFLSADDAAWLGERQRKEEQERRAASRAEGLHAFKAALTNPKVWWAASILASKACAYFGLIFFGPLLYPLLARDRHPAG